MMAPNNNRTEYIMPINVWIPKKNEIETLLRQMADKLSHTEQVCDIEEWLLDQFSELDCHISNRANVERRIIKE